MRFCNWFGAAVLLGVAAVGLCGMSETASASAAQIPLATATTPLVATGVTTPTQPDKALSGWQTIAGVRYYYDPASGTPVTGVQKIDGVYYLFDYTGAQKTGWRTVNGKRQYFDPKTGQVTTGWIQAGGYRYYADQQGKQTGEVTVSGVRYLFHESYGYQELGFCQFSDDTVSYYEPDGTIVSGWLALEDDTYYFDSHYQMLTGWQTLDGARYYFQSDGAMSTGMIPVGGSYYYFGTDGKLRTGWQTIGGGKYYFATDGKRCAGWQTIGGSQYYLGTDGKMRTGWQTIGDSRYYLGADGKMRTGWQTIDGKRYYFKANGAMAVNTKQDGYVLGADGVAREVVYAKADAILDQVGRDLKSAFDWAASLPYYGHTSDMPQTADVGTIWYANYGFDNRKGNCYVMAAVFCKMARELGYDAIQISGRVPLSSGGLGAHSWVEITLDGTTYVYDPNFTNDTGRNGYQITYGQSGTWRYVRDEVMTDK